MKTIILLISFLFTVVIVKAQCEASAGSDIQLECGDAVQLNAQLCLKKLNSNTTKNLYSVFFVNHDLGFVVGQGGTILKTTDAGNTWTSHNYLPSERYSSVFFVNENIGYAISGHLVIKTIDGGNTWTTVKSLYQSFYFNSICFTDANNGFVTGNLGLILSTSDGGVTWIQKNIGLNQLFEVTFINSQKGFIVGENSTLLKTTNGGNTWITSNPYNQPRNLFRIDFVNETVGYIGGESYLLLKTTDGGINWTKMSGSDENSNTFHSSLAFTDENTGYTCGSYGFLSRTFDSGLHWTNLFPKNNSITSFNDVCCPDNQSVITVTDNGNIFTYVEPASYHWEPASGLSSTTIPNPVATPSQTTTYIVSITSVNGCVARDTVTVFVNHTSVTPEICMVTVEPVTDHHKIIWEKQNLHTYDSVYIYKEGGVTNQFTKIGTVSSNHLSEFVDMQSNAQVQSNRYKISILDQCKFESDKSQPHKTMHLSINQGMGSAWNLIWESYQGFTVSSYNIFRGTTPGNLTLLATLPASSAQYTDLTAPQGTVYYQIGAVSSYPCSPTKSYTASVSNVASYIQVNTSVPDLCQVSVDVASNKNKISWTQVSAATIDSIIIYKEIGTSGTYSKLAEVFNNQTTEYSDLASSPSTGSSKYRLSSVNNAHIESNPGVAHKTLFLSINKTPNSCNLSWNEYAGFTVDSYNIYRGSEPGNIQKIAILSGGNSQYTDLQAPSGNLYYQVEAVNNSACNPAVTHKNSFSNIANHLTNSIDEKGIYKELSIFPNPVTTVFRIGINELNTSYHVQLYNSLGKIVLGSDYLSKGNIDISGFPAGIYFLKLTDGVNWYCSRLIKK